MNEQGVCSLGQFFSREGISREKPYDGNSLDEAFLSALVKKPN